MLRVPTAPGGMVETWRLWCSHTPSPLLFNAERLALLHCPALVTRRTAGPQDYAAPGRSTTAYAMRLLLLRLCRTKSAVSTTHAVPAGKIPACVFVCVCSS
jgi:hypothetical protein